MDHHLGTDSLSGMVELSVRSDTVAVMDPDGGVLA
jgi:hypothetical protein